MSFGESGAPVVYLKAGELYFSDKPAVVLTVLGSCLSVTMFHRRLGIGAICHGLLPQCRERTVCSGDCKEEARYVECSIRMMLRRLSRLGIPFREVEVKIFGGADMFGKRLDGRGAILVGKQNIETAQKIMDKEGIKIISMDVGGTQGRKLFFSTETGEVLLKRLQPSVVLADNGVLE